MWSLSVLVELWFCWFICVFIWVHWVSVMALWLRCPAACGTLVPWQGIEPGTSALEGGFLITEPPGKSCRSFWGYFMRRYTFVHGYCSTSSLATFIMMSQKGGLQVGFSIWPSTTTLNSLLQNKQTKKQTWWFLCWPCRLSCDDHPHNWPIAPPISAISRPAFCLEKKFTGLFMGSKTRCFIKGDTEQFKCNDGDGHLWRSVHGEFRESSKVNNSLKVVECIKTWDHTTESWW